MNESNDVSGSLSSLCNIVSIGVQIFFFLVIIIVPFPVSLFCCFCTSEHSVLPLLRVCFEDVSVRCMDLLSLQLCHSSFLLYFVSSC